MVNCKSILAAAAVFLGACSVMPQGVEINPPRIHVAADGQKASADKSLASAADAEHLPVTRYYAAMRAAQSTMGPQLPAALDGYVEAGITLVNSHCLRWFQKLSDQDAARTFADGNVNVIRELGTTLLGLGKANTYWVTSYGAANTAYAGISKNFNDVFLLAPNSRKVKAQVLDLLDARERELRTSDPPKTFDAAYRRLERFADLCTHSAAKEIVNNALDQATARASSGGKIELTPTTSALSTASDQLAKDKEQVKTERAALDRAADSLQNELRTTRQALASQTATADSLRQEAQALRQALSDLQGRMAATEEQLRALQGSGKKE